MAGKDRSAVLTAGRRPNGAYWPDPASGRMYTSSYYSSRLPGWVERANREMDPIRVPADQVRIQGVVVGLLRRY